MSYQVRSSKKVTVSEAADLFKTANISFNDPTMKSVLVDFYIGASEEEKVQFWLSILSSDQHISFKHWFSKKAMGLNFEPYCARAYQLMFKDKFPTLPIPLSEHIARDAPVNFIWVGSLVPDRYLQQIERVARCTPRKEVVLWIDRTLLNPADQHLMRELPSLSRLKGLDIKVLDINDADLDSALPESPGVLHSMIDFARSELKAMEVVSDIVRYALLAIGSEAIDRASGTARSRSSTGMIYLDTDRGPQTDETVEWGPMSAPAGLICTKHGNNDVLASAYSGHPILLETLKTINNRLSPAGKEKSLLYRNSFAHYYDTLQKTGPSCLFDTCQQVTGHPESMDEYPYFHFNSPVAGPEVCDGNWWKTDKPRHTHHWTQEIT
ncbi:hypothetical protein [Endozoicomonas arenosclerae]|uniref:hypothetical protein n=1 Tax=Endozoicomonas arenosclerae TaxID=1633495 RepID=UPI0015611DED|nr:hypothetical protein [Endozoicomonas arenosclerae]